MSRAVIDQPGLRVVAIGFFFALIFGLALRTQISSERVERSLQKTVQILQKDFSIDFASADVRLSKWGLPLPHLVISKIRLSPKKNLCQNSQIYIDELEIPFQLKNLFAAEKTVDFIRAKTVEVRLVDLDTCLSKSDQSKEKKNKGLAKPNAEPGALLVKSSDSPAVEVQVPAASSLFSQKTGTRLKEIAFDELKIVNLKNYDQPIVFKQFKVFLDYENARLARVDVRSRLYSIKDSRSDIYFLISDLNMRVVPESLNQVGVTLQLKGRLLDGDIQAFAQGSTQNQKVTYEINTRNVSLKAYAPLINRNNKETPFDKWPLSTSFYMVGDAQFGGGEPKAIFKFKNFDALGENMRVDFPEINVELVNHQARLRPFQVNLNHIPLAPLRTVLAEQYDFQSVENLGVINGLFKFEDQHHWSFDGGIEKTELIFSNRGSRELEILDSVGVNFEYKGNDLSFSLDDIVIHQNKVSGGLEGSFTKDPQELQLKLDIDGKVLNERIWKQLTQVAQNPSIKLSWAYKKTNEERHEIKIASPELEFPGLHLSDVQIDFLQLAAGDTRSLALSLKTNRTEIKVPELRPNISKAFFNEETELNSDVYLALKTQIGLQGSDWKNMNFDVDLNLFDAQGAKSLDHLKAKGEWKSDGTLSGLAALQNAKRLLKYNLVKRSKDDIEITPEKKIE